MWSIGLLIILSVVLGGAAYWFFKYTVDSGQYDDVEGPKHRMMDDDDDEEPK